MQFYFETANGEPLTQNDAIELEGVEAARAAAARYLAEAAAGQLEIGHALRCTVKDAEKRPLFRLRLNLEEEQL